MVKSYLFFEFCEMIKSKHSLSYVSLFIMSKSEKEKDLGRKVMLDLTLECYSDILNQIKKLMERMNIKTIGVLFLLQCILISNAIGQSPKLYLTNKFDKKEKYIAIGNKVKIITDGGQKYKGRLQILNDTTIVVDSNNINLSDIQEIKRKSIGQIIAGGSIALGGIYFTGLGIYAFISSVEYVGVAAFIMGGPLVAVGIAGVITGVIFLAKGKRYKNHTWEYSIE